METSFQLHDNQDNFSLEKSYPLYDVASDPGYFSAGLSPTSSEDSFLPNLALDSFFLSRPAPSPVKKSRSRYPGKKRQTASEREKLRMRDLTKAMHHLRSYLPPPAAPRDQTLTKIETLRLAARYIAFLSAQLGLSDETLEQRRRPSGRAEPPQTLSQFLGQREEPCDQATAEQIFTGNYNCQFPSDASFDAQQCWLPQQQLHDFSGQR
ncbi:uncharacterized protein LOC144050299 [Vanacampus margaritifer]